VCVRERLGSGASTLASGGRQQQHRQFADPTAELAAAQQIDTSVSTPEDPEEQIRGHLRLFC
jgi:hypothetical protein